MGKRGRPPHPDILTPREWQVLDLLRRDLTDEQLAQRLDISFATAKYHVAEIISKLGVQTREEAAAWQPQAVAIRWWQRAVAWLPSRTWPLAGAVGALAALAAAGLLVWSLGDRAEEQPAVAATSPSLSGPPSETPLATLATSTRGPSLLPEGSSQLAYIGSDFALWLVNADGTGKQRITDQCGGPVWSPQGDLIACTGFTDPYYTISVIDLTGTEIWNTDRTAAAYSPVWSPDGRHIAYRAEDESLHIAELASASDTILQSRAFPLDWLSNEQLLTGFNVDSEQLAPSYDAHLVDIRTLQAQPMPYFNRPFWLTPDGRKALVLGPGSADGFGVVIYDLETGSETPIPNVSIGAATEGIPPSLVTFSEDGSLFYAANQLKRPTQIYTGPLDGSSASLLGTVPAVSPVEISSEGFVAYCASLNQSPEHITIADLRTGTAWEIEGRCGGAEWRSVE